MYENIGMYKYFPLVSTTFSILIYFGILLLLKLTLNHYLFKNKLYRDNLVTCYSYSLKIHLWSFLALLKQDPRTNMYKQELIQE